MRPEGNPSFFEIDSRVTGAGPGNRLCLVSDSRAQATPTAHKTAKWLAEGWQVTLLDLSPFDGPPNIPHGQNAGANLPYRYVRLATFFREKNWYDPMRSLCAYNWLRDQPFDLIIFQHGFGAAYFSCKARRQKLAFANVPIIIFADTPYLYNLERAQFFPAAPRTDVEIDFLERESVDSADALFSSDPDALSWLLAEGWIKRDSHQRVARLGEDASTSFGEWLEYNRRAETVPEVAPAAPSVSVLLDASGAGPTELQDAITSLSNQKYENFDVIVFDPANDPSLASLRKTTTSLFSQRKWTWQQKDRIQSKGDWLLIMDGRSKATPDELEFFARVAGSGADIFTCVPGLDAEANIGIPPLAHFPFRKNGSDSSLPLGWVPVGPCPELNLYMNCLGDTHIFARRAVYEKLDGFRRDLNHLAAGWDFLTRAMLTGQKIDVVPEILFFDRRYRTGRGSAGDINFNNHAILVGGMRNLPFPTPSYAFLAGLRGDLANKNKAAAGRFPHFERKPHKAFAAPAVYPTPQIVFCADDNYASQVSIALASLFSSHKENLDVHVISSLSDAQEKQLNAVAGHFGRSIAFVSGQPHLYGAVKMAPLHGNKSTSMYARIFIPHYLPHLSRALYLDSDIMVRRSLLELWRTDLDGNPLGAVADPSFISDHEFLNRFGGDHFNSGVLLMDLDVWHKENLTDEIMKHVYRFEQVSPKPGASKNTSAWPESVHYWDQSSINMGIGGRWTALSPTWNYCERVRPEHKSHYRLEHETFEAIRRDPHIYHFLGHEKPWFDAYRSHTVFAREYQIYEKLVRTLRNA